MAASRNSSGSKRNTLVVVNQRTTSFNFHSSSERTFRVRVVLQGEAYGFDDCNVHDGALPLVEFYEYQSPSKSTPHIATLNFNTLFAGMDGTAYSANERPWWNTIGVLMGKGESAVRIDPPALHEVWKRVRDIMSPVELCRDCREAHGTRGWGHHSCGTVPLCLDCADARMARFM